MKTQEIVNLFYPKGLNDIADTIGPQGDLLAKLEKFNEKYCYGEMSEPLRITKKWRWSPGTYDKVKVCYTRKVMQWHRRPRHMYSIFNRRREWYANDMKRELNDIETALITSRRENAVWLDENTDDGILQQAVYEFSSKINELTPIASLNNVVTSFWQARRCDVSQQVYHGPDRTEELLDGVYIFAFEFQPKPIVVTKDDVVIGSISFPALTVCAQINVNKWMNAILNPTQDFERLLNSQYLKFGVQYNVSKGLIIPGLEEDLPRTLRPIWHPFVNRPDRGPGFRQVDGRLFSWSNICMGNHQANIVHSFMTMEWNAFFYHIQEWLFKYEIINANPLNNIRFAFLGLDENQNTELLDVVGYSGKWCAERLTNIFRDQKPDEIVLDPHKEIVNFCDSIRKCSYRKKCDGYKFHLDKIKEEESLDDDKKEMLKWASEVSGGRVGRPATSFEDILSQAQEDNLTEQQT